MYYVVGMWWWGGGCGGGGSCDIVVVEGNGEGGVMGWMLWWRSLGSMVVMVPEVVLVRVIIEYTCGSPLFLLNGLNQL